MWGLTWKGKESKGKLVQTGQKDYIGNWGNDYLNGLGRGGDIWGEATSHKGGCRSTPLQGDTIF